jgi:hypothetical protein
MVRQVVGAPDVHEMGLVADEEERDEHRGDRLVGSRQRRARAIRERARQRRGEIPSASTKRP